MIVLDSATNKHSYPGSFIAKYTGHWVAIEPSTQYKEIPRRFLWWRWVVKEKVDAAAVAFFYRPVAVYLEVTDDD